MKENATELVKLAKRGDTHAFAMLYEQIYKDLYRFALCTVKNPHQAEDIVSSSVLSAFENMHSLKKDSAFKSWMFQIVANECKRSFRLQSRTISYDNDELFDEACTTDTDLTDHIILQQALGHLDDEERLVIGLSTYGGYSGKEISKIIKKKEGTVRSIKSRAMDKMKQFIGMEESI